MKKYLYILLFGLGIIACNEKEDTPTPSIAPDASIELSEKLLLFCAEGDTKVITVTSNQDSVTIRSLYHWCIPKLTGNTLSLTCKVNDRDRDREAFVEVIAGSGDNLAKDTVYIKQSAIEKCGILLSEDFKVWLFNATSSKGNLLTQNGNFQFLAVNDTDQLTWDMPEKPEWLYVELTDIHKDRASFSISVDENLSEALRSYDFELTLGKGSAQARERIYVTQGGRRPVNLFVKELPAFDAEGGTKVLSVSVDRPYFGWTLEEGDHSWIHLAYDKTKPYELSIQTDPLPEDVNERSIGITIHVEDVLGNVSKTVTIRQKRQTATKS